MQSLYQAFRQAWRPDAVFMRTPEARCWTYADLDGITADLSLRIRAARLQPGDRLVALVERSAWNIFLYLACVRAGVVYVPLNPGLTANELAPVIADADPALVVCAPRLESFLAGLMRASISLRTLDQDGKGSLLELAPDAGEPDATLQTGHPAAIIFTSGTTGRPKGALMPHELFIGKARSLGSALAFAREDRLLHTLPLYHAHGLFMTLHCVLNASASLVLLPRFDATEVVRWLPDASVFSGVPTMYKRLVDEPGLAAAAAGTRLFISGSAALPGEVFKTFEQHSGHRIVECWGMSETMTNTANPLHDCRPGSAGKPLPGVVLRVTNPEGQPLPAGMEGTLEVGFPAPFGGYWRRPASEQPVLRNGCMVTGDIGYLSEEGYLTIVGRSSEVIISGGYNVYPREVEMALEELPEIARAAVFAVPHADYGEAVVAAIEPALSAAVDAAGLLQQLRSRLVGYKLPKALFVEPALPLTELGKIQRKALAQKYSQYFFDRN